MGRRLGRRGERGKARGVCLPRRVFEAWNAVVERPNVRAVNAALARRTDSLDGLTPVEVAAGLSHLPGLVFFDTAGHLPASYGAPVSIIGARPRALIEGSIHEPRDRARLRASLAAGAGAPAAGG